MEKDEIAFIRKEIERSGFPLEIETSQILEKDGWDVYPSTFYLDKDEEKWREIDIRAEKSSFHTRKEDPQITSVSPYRVLLFLMIECKKSEDYGWIFFNQPREEYELHFPKIMFHSHLSVAKFQSLLKEGLISGSLLERIQRLDFDPKIADEKPITNPDTAREIKLLHQLGINPGTFFRCLCNELKARFYTEIKLQRKSKRTSKNKSLNEIFKAINVVIKATKERLESSSSRIYNLIRFIELGESFSLDIHIYLPIIVFDGKLYSYCNGEVIEENEVLLEGRCYSKRYSEEMPVIIVKKERFTGFLQRINEDFIKLIKAINKHKAVLDEQTQMIFSGVE